jgi:hypothetical protein
MAHHLRDWEPYHQPLAALAIREAATGNTERAIEEADHIRHRRWKVAALAGITPYLPLLNRAEQVRKAHTLTLEWDDAIFQAQCYGMLAPLASCLPPAERRHLLHAAAQAVQSRALNPDHRIREIAAIAPYLTARQRKMLLQKADEALQEVHSLWDMPAAVRALVLCYARLGDWEGVRRAARTPHLDPAARCRIWAATMPQFPPEHRPKEIEATKTIEMTASIETRETEAIESSHRIMNQMPARSRVSVLDCALPYLAPNARKQALLEALAVVHAIEDRLERTQTIAAIIPLLAAQGASAHAQEALQEVVGLSDPADRNHLLSNLAISLAQTDRQNKIAYLRLALAAVALIDRESYDHSFALENIVPFLDAELLEQVPPAVAEIPDSSRRKTVLLALVKRWLCMGLVEKAWEVVKSQETPFPRYDAYATLVLHLPLSLPLSLLWEMWNSLPTSWYSNDAQIRAALIRRLATAGEAAMALTEARALADPQLRARTMAGIARYYPETQNLQQQALDTASTAPYPMMALAEIAQDLMGRHQEEAWRRARELAGDNAGSLISLLSLAPPAKRPAIASDVLETMQADDLRSCTAANRAQLYAYLPLPSLQKLVHAARKIENDYERDECLVGLLPRLAELGQIEEAFACAARMTRREFQGIALAGMARFLNTRQQEERALIAAQVLDEAPRADALAGLAPCLPASLLEKALAMAREIGSAELREKALSGLAPSLAALPVPDIYRLWRETLHRAAERSRPHLLTDLRALTPLLERMGGTPALLSLLRSVCDVGGWWP